MDMLQELNYICNSDIFNILFVMKTNLPKVDERKKVAAWLKKIMKNNKTLSDLKLRNEFLHYLSVSVQNGALIPPFHQDPPKHGLKVIMKQLPGHEDIQVQDDEAVTLLRFLPAKKGGFILPKPLPAVGAYCYISATSRIENSNNFC